MDIGITKSYHGNNVGEGIVSQVLKQSGSYSADCRGQQ